MDQARYAEVSEAFQAALAQGGDARQAFLRALRARDSRVHAEVLSLLAHDTDDPDAAFNEDELGRAGERIAALAGTNPEEAPAEIAGARVLEVLGQGGMGTVYLCQQAPPLERRIAVKVVRRGRDTEETLRRFDIEREALARMDHPGIARVLEAGSTEDGQPYFAMEYVDGRPLVADCDARRLDVRSRLRVFVEVLRALHHAHQRGVLHRDLKPSNILVATVDGTASPRIIDFGLARALEAVGAREETVVGQVLGTPAYMSPEQCALDPADVDVRSDVYSAGIVLYELLTGKLPFESDSEVPVAVAMRRRASGEVTAPRPSTRIRAGDSPSAEAAAQRRLDPHDLAKTLRRELDWIVLRALEFDRERRYESAAEFANDLEAYLELRPVLAAPPRWTYRAAKMLRRHRAASVATALVLASLVAATIVSVKSARAARAAELKTLDLLDDVTAQNKVLSQMLLVADPTVGGPEAKVIDALQLGIDFAIENYHDRPRVLTEVMGSIGSTFRELGMLEDAERCLVLALENQLKVEPFDPLQLTYKHNGLALLYQDTGRLELAEKHFRLALETAEGIDAEIRMSETGVLLVNLGGLLVARGRYDEAKAVIDASYAIHREHMPDQKVGLAVIAGKLSKVAEGTGRIDEAIQFAREALDYAYEAHPEKHPHVAIRRLAYGELLVQADPRDPRALELYEGALRSALGAFGRENPKTLRYYVGLIQTLCSAGEADRAEERIREMERIVEEGGEGASEGLWPARALRGLLCFARGDDAAALERLSEAIDPLGETTPRNLGLEAECQAVLARLRKPR